MSTEIHDESYWESMGLGIAGRQLVTDCKAVGDLVINATGERWLCDPSALFSHIIHLGQRVYRKIPVASQGELDHNGSKPKLEPKGSNIAEKAIDLVCGDRNASYGDPADDYAGTAKVWSGLLSRKLKEEITPREAILMMAALKINREFFKPKEDSRIDAIGYMLCADWVATGKQPEKSQ